MQFSEKTVREHIISFRLTGLEAGKIEALAKQSSIDLSISEACRAICLHRIDKHPPAPPKRKIKARRKPHIGTEKVSKSLALIGQISTEIRVLRDNADKNQQMPSVGILRHIQQNLIDIKTDLSKALVGDPDGY